MALGFKRLASRSRPLVLVANVGLVVNIYFIGKHLTKLYCKSEDHDQAREFGGPNNKSLDCHQSQIKKRDAVTIFRRGPIYFLME